MTNDLISDTKPKTHSKKQLTSRREPEVLKLIIRVLGHILAPLCDPINFGLAAQVVSASTPHQNSLSMCFGHTFGLCSDISSNKTTVKATLAVR